MARGEAVAPAGPRARPREASPAPVNFCRKIKGARAQMLIRFLGMVCTSPWRMVQLGRPASWPEGGEGARASTVRFIGSGYQTAERDR